MLIRNNSDRHNPFPALSHLLSIKIEMHKVIQSVRIVFSIKGLNGFRKTPNNMFIHAVLRHNFSWQ